jgi:hypothetical protein
MSYPTKIPNIYKLFEGLTSASILKITRNYEQGRSPYHGYEDEEDLRLAIDDLFDETIRDNPDTTLTEIELHTLKHKFMDTIFDILDDLVDKYEKRTFNQQ